jgi:hypothetical protein
MPNISAFRYSAAFLLPLVVLSFSCESTNETNLPLASPEPGTPIVTGLNVTGPNGPEVIAVWRSPSDPVARSIGYHTDPEGAAAQNESPSLCKVQPIVPRDTKFSNPYPNPFFDTCALSFALPKRTLVDLWIVRARWIEEGTDDLGSVSGASIVSVKKNVGKEFFRQRLLEAGYYQIQWDGCDQSGNVAPAGFYRIYFRANDDLYWHDVLLYRNVNDLPGDLRELMGLR